MTLSRFMVAVPVLAGLVVTGSAVARMLPAQSVRDSVYQTCAHNGVHFNKQGHANCGLHKGWSQGEPTTPPDQPVTDTGTSATDSGTTTTSTGHGKGHTTHVHPSHPAKGGHGAKTHSAKTHGASGHGGGRSAHNKHG